MWGVHQCGYSCRMHNLKIQILKWGAWEDIFIWAFALMFFNFFTKSFVNVFCNSDKKQNCSQPFLHCISPGKSSVIQNKFQSNGSKFHMVSCRWDAKQIRRGYIFNPANLPLTEEPCVFLYFCGSNMQHVTVKVCNKLPPFYFKGNYWSQFVTEPQIRQCTILFVCDTHLFWLI